MPNFILTVRSLSPLSLKMMATGEEKRKEQYLSVLGLVTKSAMLEIQSKRSGRKRRSTANPKFSTAAIEAKRAVAIEVAIERTKKRAAKEARVQQRKRPALLTPNIRTQSQLREPKQSNVVLADNESQAIVPQRRRSLMNPQPKRMHPPLLSTCHVCAEECKPELDIVIFCEECRFFFHATCVNDDMHANGLVACPKCQDMKLMSKEVTVQEMSTLTYVPKTVKKVKVHSQKGQSVILNGVNGSSQLVDLKSHFKAKLDEQWQLVQAKLDKERQWSESKTFLQVAKDKLKALKDAHGREEVERAITVGRISRLSEFVDSIRDLTGVFENCSPIIDLCPALELDVQIEVDESMEVKTAIGSDNVLTNDLSSTIKTYTRKRTVDGMAKDLPELMPYDGQITVVEGEQVQELVEDNNYATYILIDERGVADHGGLVTDFSEMPILELNYGTTDIEIASNTVWQFEECPSSNMTFLIQ